MEEKIKTLCELITKESQAQLEKSKLACQCNLDNAVAHYHTKKKYTYIDKLSSGCYMVDNATQEIFGIKAYGVIHKGHNYGTLDTINSYYWGNYRAILKGV